MVAKIHMDKLESVKKNIEGWYEYFKRNNDRYHEFMKFVFQTSISEDDMTKLDILGKPALEFNILESKISRLRGEFSKHEPAIEVRAADGVKIEELTPLFNEQIRVTEAHLREIFADNTADDIDYKVYTGQLAGGYAVVEVFTDYINQTSFDQNINVKTVFDPTLCGFDPLARESHKGDGMYCFKIYPKTREEFEEEFGEGSASKMQFIRTVSSSNLGGFSWSYTNQQVDIVLVADYFFKKRKKDKIIKLSNGHTVVKSHYPKLIEMWNEQGFIEQPPIPIEERDTVIETIERYVLCEDKILSHDITNFKYLPLVFFDGDSVNIQESSGGSTSQMTRPIVYHAKGVQQLKNFAGQTVASEIENMVQHKFKVAVESIPEAYQDAYKNVQQASTLVYNAFYKDDPEVPLPPPMEIQRTPTPPIVENTFMGTDRVTQVILGSYDSVLGTNDKQISGVAIQQGALQCDATALPYLKNFVNGKSRLAQIVMDLIPKYYVTPRSLPIKLPDGKRSYQVINQPENPNSIDLMYNPDNFQIKIEVGVSSGVQKQVALEKIIQMMGASEAFAQFINSMGLETILDNLDIRGIDNLKSKAVEFMNNLKAQQEAAAQQPNPIEIEAETYKEVEMAKLEQQAMKTQGEMAIQAAKVANDKQELELKLIKILSEIDEMKAKLMLDQEKIDAENSRSAVELAIDVADKISSNGVSQNV